MSTWMLVLVVWLGCSLALGLVLGVAIRFGEGGRDAPESSDSDGPPASKEGPAGEEAPGPQEALDRLDQRESVASQRAVLVEVSPQRVPAERPESDGIVLDPIVFSDEDIALVVLAATPGDGSPPDDDEHE